MLVYGFSGINCVECESGSSSRFAGSFSQIRQRGMEMFSVPLSVPTVDNIKRRVDLKKVKDLLRELIPLQKKIRTRFLGLLWGTYTVSADSSVETYGMGGEKFVNLEPDVILKKK